MFFSQPYSARLQELASEMTERHCSGARLSSDGMVFQVAVWSHEHLEVETSLKPSKLY